MTPIEAHLRYDIDTLQVRMQDDKERNSSKISATALNALERASKALLSSSSKIFDKKLLSEADEVMIYFSERSWDIERLEERIEERELEKYLLSVRLEITKRKIELAASCFEVRTGNPPAKETLASVLFPPTVLSLPHMESQRIVSSKIEEMKEQRFFLAHQIDAAYAKLFPEGRFAYPEERVSDKYFPPTYAWYIGSLPQGEGDFLEEMIQIAQEYGIQVISDSLMRYFSAPNFVDNHCEFPQCAPFPQDYMDFTKSAVQVPFSRYVDGKISFRDREALEFREAIFSSRKKRSPLWESCPQERLQAILGLSYEEPHIRKPVFLAEATKTSISMNISYNEGGNTLLGRDQNGPYAIIGWDSYTATEHCLRKIRDEDISEAEVKKAFAIDYGIPEDRIYFVEQPGDFHLDMSMAIVGERTVFLNDARAAYSMFSEARAAYIEEKREEIERRKEKEIRELQQRGAWTKEKDEEICGLYEKSLYFLAEEDAAMQNEMQHVAAFEDLVQKQLEGHGFTVLRRPGKFDYSVKEPAMNFFNMVTATAPGGQKVIVAMGCISKEYEVLFKQYMQEAGIAEEVHIHFLPLEASMYCLSLYGGISCRTKTIPEK